MKTKTILGLATAAAILVGGLITTRTLAADDSALAAHPQRGQFLKRMAEKLKLTSDQKSQIKTIVSGEKDTLKTLIGQLHEARKNLRSAIQAADANEASVRAVSDKVAAVESDLAVERMKLFGKIAPILTDEQRRQISDFTQRADDAVDMAIANIGTNPAE